LNRIDTLIRVGLEKEWYAYRYLALMKIAEEWCEDNDIAYKRKKVLPK